MDRVPNRGIITVCAMVATLMQALDSTIANVALPYMQGSLSATSDQITWVLTSYIVAAAIMTAPVGWLSARFGRKNLFITCLVGFTVASMLCGIAQSLEQMVLFRLLQGVFGAALVPLSQSTMLDIYPPEQRGSAMAIFLPKADAKSEMRFDWTGFAVLAIGIGALQLMLDRGETKDWFSAREVVIEAVLAGLGLYLFVVHMATSDRPFIAPAVFRDRNLCVSFIVMFSVGMLLLATSALLAPWLQTLGGYPVEKAGLLLAPRGVGTMVAMLIAGRLSSRVDPRKLMAFGVALLCFSLWSMTGWTPDASATTVAFNTIIQGAGIGFVFIPLQVVAFATLPQAVRTDGTSLLSLFRNLGSAIGVSVTSTMLARNEQAAHADLAAYITPFNRALQGGSGNWAQQMLNPVQGTAVVVVPGAITNTPMLNMQYANATLLDSLVNHQALIIAYLDDFKLMLLTSAPTVLLLLLLRRPARNAAVPADAHAAMD